MVKLSCLTGIGILIIIITGKGATVTQRMNPDGSPFVTDDGNPYLHVTGLVTPTTDIAALDHWYSHLYCTRLHPWYICIRG
jgi:hypothetical protein